MTPDPDALREAFARAHEERYGYRDDAAEVELVTIRASAFGEPPPLRPAPSAARAPGRSACAIAFEGEPVQALMLAGAPIPGERVSGPALCSLGESTLLIAPGWSGGADAHGTIRLERAR
jgi:N-methylhydantoinase A